MISSDGRVLLWLLVALVSGCTTDLETFSAELPPAACDHAELCGGALASEDACEEGFAATLDDLSSSEDCAYDANQAWQCLRTLEAGNCEEKTALYYECKRVFKGDDCELDLLDTLY